MADRRLQVFHAVAKRRSFTKAAESLHMTQPAVTFQVKQLEESLNTRLFERNPGGIELTPAGAVVLGYAERILGLGAELETRIREMTGAVSGPLLVGASMTIAEFLLPRVLGEFRTEHPGVQAKLTVGNSETILARVAEHTLDIGLIESPAGISAVDAGALEIEACGEDELQVVVAAGHPLAKHPSILPAMLAEFPFISREPGSGTREFTDLYLRRCGIDPAALELVMELGSPEAVKGVAETGVGFAVMSRASVEKELRMGTLAARPLDPRLIRSLSLVYPREKFRSRLVGAFVGFAKTRLRA